MTSNCVVRMMKDSLILPPASVGACPVGLRAGRGLEGHIKGVRGAGDRFPDARRCYALVSSFLCSDERKMLESDESRCKWSGHRYLADAILAQNMRVVKSGVFVTGHTWSESCNSAQLV
jgi:hypothetical protein